MSDKVREQMGDGVAGAERVKEVYRKGSAEVTRILGGVRRIEGGGGAVEVRRSGIVGHVVLRVVAGPGNGVALRADEAAQVVAAVMELLPQSWPGAAPAAVTPPATEFPSPHVVNPTLLQFVKGARAEYQDGQGRVLQGWVSDFGVWRDLYDQEAPPAARVSISSCRPGDVCMSMAMPDQVLVERVLRVTCFPDPSPAPCWKCHQSGEPKGGAHSSSACSACGRPTTHDEEASVKGADTDPRLGQRTVRPLEQRMVEAFEAGDIPVPDSGGYEAKTQAGKALLDSLTLEQRQTGMATYAIREGHRRIRATGDMGDGTERP